MSAKGICGQRTEALRRINGERTEGKAARRAVIDAITKTWDGPKWGRYRMRARHVRDRWKELAPDIPPPSLRSLQEHLRALRGT
jgi:hypothetical protein